MNYLHLDLSDINSINNIFSDSLSDFGTETDVYTKTKYQTGGLFELFGSSGHNCEEIMLMAAAEKNYNVVDFFVSHELIKNYDYKDKHGNTIFHYIAMHYNEPQLRNNVKLVNSIISNANSNNLNIQNNDGNTPTHLAVKSGSNEIIAIFIEKGANKSIKNKEGFYIQSFTENDTDTAPVGTDTATLSNTIQIPGSQSGGGENDSGIIATIKRFFLGEDKSNEPTSITESDTNIQNSPRGGNMDTEQFLDALVKKHMSSNNKPSSNNPPSTNAMSDTEQLISQLNKYTSQVRSDNGNNNSQLDKEDTEQFLNNLINKYNTKSGSNQSGGKQLNKYTSQLDNEDTEQFLNNLINKYNSQSGSKQYGGKQSNESSRSGSRKLLSYKHYNEYGHKDNTYSDEIGAMLSNQANEIRNRVLKRVQDITKSSSKKANEYVTYMEGVIDDENPGNSNLDKKVELEKMASKPQNVNKFKEASEIHKEVIEKIKKLLKIDDDEVARNYKAALWNMAKEKLPNGDNLEQSKEMKKLATKKVLDSIDISTAQALRAESQKRRQEKRGNKQMPESESSYTISATSSFSVPSVSSYSNTSYSDSYSQDTTSATSPY